MKSKSLNSNGGKFNMYAPLLFLLPALLPEYFAPVFSIVIFILILKKRISENKKPEFGKLGLAILVFMAWMVVCSVYSSSVITSVASIGLWCLMFTGYYAFTETVKTEEALDRVFYFGCLSSGISGLTGIVQMVFYHLDRRIGTHIAVYLNPFWRFLDFGVEKLVKYLPSFISSNMASKTFHSFITRACGTFSNPLFFATFCVAMLPFAAYTFLCSQNKKRRIIGFICCLLDIGGVALSYSRGPYLYAVIVFFLLLLYGGKKGLKLMALGGVGVGALAIFASGIFKRLLTLISGKDISVNTRKQVWDAAFAMLREKPFFGYGTGFDNIRRVMHEVYKVKQPHAHNIFLETWLENGVIGAVLLAAIFIVFYINILRLAKLGSNCRNIAVTLFASVTGFLLCGMTDCIFYGLKPLQYMMLVLGLSQAAFAIYLNKKSAASPSKKDKETSNT